MSYEVNGLVPPPERSRTLRRAGVITALAVGLVAGGFGIASAASAPTPTPTQIPSPNQSSPCGRDGACPHAGGRAGSGEHRPYLVRLRMVYTGRSSRRRPWRHWRCRGGRSAALACRCRVGRPGRSGDTVVQDTRAAWISSKASRALARAP